jgi:CubicO group peptidase (beta-lactamase class C family)
VRILSVISLGGKVNGVRLLQPETIEKIFDVQSDGPDVVLLGHPLRWGLGYGLPQQETFPYIPDGKICFWGGWGGSWETMNPDRRTTTAYVMNKMAAGDVGGQPIDRPRVLIRPNPTPACRHPSSHRGRGSCAGSRPS